MTDKNESKKGKKRQQKLISLGRAHQVVGKAVIIELASANLPPLDSIVLLNDEQQVGPIVDFIGSVKHPWAVAVNKKGVKIPIGVKVKAKPPMSKKSFKKKKKGHPDRKRSRSKTGKKHSTSRR